MLMEQIAGAEEIVALAAHVEGMETIGPGAGEQMPSIDILGSARQLLGSTRSDAPGLPGTGYSAFALCDVVGEVEKIMTEDAVDPGDAWYGAEDPSLDSEDSEIFVSEDVEVGEGLRSINSSATSPESPRCSTVRVGPRLGTEPTWSTP